MSSVQLKLPPTSLRPAAVHRPPENTPDPEPLRSGVVARGLGLAVDPGYPGPKVILVVGEHLVKLFQ